MRNKVGEGDVGQLRDLTHFEGTTRTIGRDVVLSKDSFTSTCYVTCYVVAMPHVVTVRHFKTTSTI